MQPQERIVEPTGPEATGESTRRGLDLRTCGVAALGGALCGALAVLFRLSLEFAEDAYADGLVAAHELHDYGWLAGLILFAALGALAGWVTFRFAPEASGSGIPHVKDVLRSGRIMRWRTLLPVKFFGGLCALGAGMSLGREGPTVQMGAAISEGLAQRFALAPPVRRALIAAGAGAGLTAAFNAPLAGFVFVLEELRL